jgi:hypothetical protein
MAPISEAAARRRVLEDVIGARRVLVGPVMVPSHPRLTFVMPLPNLPGKHADIRYALEQWQLRQALRFP